MPYINDTYIPEDRYMDLSGTEEPIWPHLSLWLCRGLYGVLVCVAVYSSWRGLSSHVLGHQEAEEDRTSPRPVQACSPCRYWLPIVINEPREESELDKRLQRRIPLLYWHSRVLGQRPWVRLKLQYGPTLIQGGYAYKTVLTNGVRSWQVEPRVSVYPSTGNSTNVVRDMAYFFRCTIDGRLIQFLADPIGQKSRTPLRATVCCDEGATRDPRRIAAAKCIADILISDILLQQSSALCTATNIDLYALVDRWID